MTRTQLSALYWLCKIGVVSAISAIEKKTLIYEKVNKREYMLLNFAFTLNRKHEFYQFF